MTASGKVQKFALRQKLRLPENDRSQKAGAS